MPLLLPVTKARFPSSCKFIPALLLLLRAEFEFLGWGPAARNRRASWLEPSTRLTEIAVGPIDSRPDRLKEARTRGTLGGKQPKFYDEVPAWFRNLPPRRREGVDRGRGVRRRRARCHLQICSAAA